MTQGNQQETSMLESSFFLYLIYYVIKYDDPMDVTFIIECLNENVIREFYMSLRSILDPYNCKLRPNSQLFMLRHNIPSIKDVNSGSMTDNIKNKNDGKKTAIGFHHVSRHTTPIPKTSGRCSKKIFAFHLANFYNSGEDVNFAVKYLSPQMFTKVFGSLLRVFEKTNVDLTESLIQMWTKQCFSAVFNSVNVISNVVPSVDAFRERTKNNDEIAQIEKLADSINPWSSGETLAVAAATVQDEDHWNAWLQIPRNRATNKKLKGDMNEGEPISQCYHNANENVESFTHDETHVIQNGKEDEKTDEKFVAAGEDHVSYEHQDTSQENNHLINSPSTPLQDENWNNPLTLQDVIMQCDLPVLGNGDEEQFNFDDVDLCKFIYYLLLECIYNFYLFFTGTPRPVIHPENTSRSKWKQRSFDADLDYEV
ncbi:uncharacterized protein LOC121833813 [Ixodes scapularis]|uniref:uncharacterized protein LOC121833813 n=1 Tax=Ixodes scapularis TaxID=6945 RepID=UPI001C3819E7|nr:uncharacterized protein LOC121833813 [Ixodes scapularis]